VKDRHRQWYTRPMPWFLVLSRPCGMPFEKILAESLQVRSIQAETWNAGRNLTWLRVERLTPEVVDAVHGCPGSFGFAGSNPVPVGDEEMAKLRAGTAAGAAARPAGLLGALFTARPDLPPPPVPPPLDPEVAAALRRPSYETRRSWRITVVTALVVVVALAVLALASLSRN
jgi:hypothetical protein